MAIDPEEERGERRDVDDAQPVRLARLEGERRVLVEPAQVRRVLREVDEPGVRDGLGAAGVRDAEEVVGERRVLVVVPVGEDDGELGVVAVDFGGRVEEEGRAQAVGVLALWGVRWRDKSRRGGEVPCSASAPSMCPTGRRCRPGRRM